jgi:hypothetical protein
LIRATDTTVTTHDGGESVEGCLVAAPSPFKVTIRSPRRRSSLDAVGERAGIALIISYTGSQPLAAVAIRFSMLPGRAHAKDTHRNGGRPRLSDS